MAALEVLSTRACFGGSVAFCRHESLETGTPMRFGVFVPPQAEAGPVPAVYYLAGLECTEETFLIKANAVRVAAEFGLMLVAPDTSPRGAGIAGEDDDWTFGTGAGFYVDATAQPWAAHYRMYSYVTRELPALISANFPENGARRGIFGHSMGGHGALVIGLREPRAWRSVSAFAPIANPVAVPWGENAFSRYLGPDRAAWAEYDASLLMQKFPHASDILVDQGDADPFLETQLHPDALEAAAAKSGQRLTLRRQPGYDHSYWIIQSFIADHLAWHGARLHAP